MFVVLAAVVAIRSDPKGDRIETVVATRDLASGVELTADDVRLENRLAATVPDGSQSNVGAVIGATLAGPARRGELLTDVLAAGASNTGTDVGPLLVATDAVVVLVSEKPKGAGGRSDRVVLVALPAPAANDVAAAALLHTVTLTFH